MQAQVGDRLLVNGHGQRSRAGEITEVRNEDGSPTYLVRFDDGQEQLVYPGPDVVVESGNTDV